MSSTNSKAVSAFRRAVWTAYRTHGRHDLLWRRTRDPWRILVSEVMLQQTQVERVIPFYTRFVKRFPTAGALARVQLADALRAWQGLGYNRRAKQLHAAAKEIATHGMPRDAAALERLPGVGPYTARAVAAFAYNEDGIVLETNIRTAVIHHFFPRRRTVSDAEIEAVLAICLSKRRARAWYSALMDYGARLKRFGVSHNAKSRHYAKQPAFKGSLREARGAILRALAQGSASARHLTGLLGPARRPQLRIALAALAAEGLVARSRGRAALAG
ncbi:MAG TPA: A/G-specific adenine glycosylase [Candidatus Paceibacterota bacterium]|nr:A/G-specific adenine glycosylase [Candidatus Paceibacterota bacterium]